MSVTQLSSTPQTTAARPMPRPAGTAAGNANGSLPADTFTPSSGNDSGIYRPMSFVSSNGSGGPQHVSDPTLDHNRQICDPNLSDRRLVGADGQWDGGTILNAQSQLDTHGTSGQESRCGPSSMIGGAVMAGPEATARVAERLSANASPEEAERLRGVRDRLLDGTATHGDISTLQESAYNRYNTNGTAGMDASEMTSMQKDLAGSVRFDPVGNTTTDTGGERAVPEQGKVVEEPGRTFDRIDNLKNGESFSMGVDTNGDGQMNHWVQVGRDDKGRNYVYDPYPAANQPHVSHPDPDGDVGPYENYTEGYMGAVAPDGRQVNVVGGGAVKF
ncbi:MAG: hypothetical protein KC910_22560 [Candidatus Eremiobacteraeota bacterium]|nr:hypothetical protein [Candidatus Eremiobacteraeota bacterium]